MPNAKTEQRLDWVIHIITFYILVNVMGGFRFIIIINNYYSTYSYIIAYRMHTAIKIIITAQSSHPFTHTAEMTELLWDNGSN